MKRKDYRWLIPLVAVAVVWIVIILLLIRSRTRTKPAPQAVLVVPETRVEPVAIKTTVNGTHINVFVLYDRLISEQDARKYARSVLAKLMAKPGQLHRACGAAGNVACMKVLVRIYTDRYVFDKASENPKWHEEIFATWNNPLSPDAETIGQHESNFLPKNPNKMSEGLSKFSKTALLSVARLTVVNRDTLRLTNTFIIGEQTPAMAREACLYLLDANGAGTQMMRLIQLYPEITTLQVESPVNGQRPLRMRVSRENLYRLNEIGRLHMKRSRYFVDADSEIEMQHFHGKLTDEEAKTLQSRLKIAKADFYAALWRECEEFLEPVPARDDK